MNRSEPPGDPSRPEPGDADRPAPWKGAPGYVPHPELPPHSPMPGAPPYPAAVDHPPPPVGRVARTPFRRALGAAAVWAAVNLVLVLVLTGPAPSAAAAGRLVGGLLAPALLAALVGWLVARRGAWPFWLLVLVVAPIFWFLRVLTALPAA